MIVCLQKVSCIKSVGFEILNPSIEILVPMALQIATLKEAGHDWFCEEIEVAHDAVLLKLPHFGLDLLSQLIDRAKRNMKLGELKVAAVVIRPTEIVPCAVVGDFNFGPISGNSNTTTTLEERGTGIRGDEIHHRNIEFDGNQAREVKALVKASHFIDSFKIV